MPVSEAAYHRVVAWRRQTDGSYEESALVTGVVRLAALPQATIDLDDLFAWAEDGKG